MIIAIDGPAGAGKTTISKCVAKKLGFMNLDTGAMYRCVALKALNQKADLNDSDALSKIASSCIIGFSIDENGKQCVLLNSRDVTSSIRTPEVDKAVTPVSADKEVRKLLVKQQQELGAEGNFVVEGRDICTVVFPEAELKIFLTVSPEERAHRRVRQNIDNNAYSNSYQDVLDDINRRDVSDSTREESPLKQADDAVLLDSTGLYIEEVIEKICLLAKDKMKTI